MRRPSVRPRTQQATNVAPALLTSVQGAGEMTLSGQEYGKALICTVRLLSGQRRTGL